MGLVNYFRLFTHPKSSGLWEKVRSADLRPDCERVRETVCIWREMLMEKEKQKREVWSWGQAPQSSWPVAWRSRGGQDLPGLSVVLQLPVSPLSLCAKFDVSSFKWQLVIGRIDFAWTVHWSNLRTLSLALWKNTQCVQPSQSGPLSSLALNTSMCCCRYIFPKQLSLLFTRWWDFFFAAGSSLLMCCSC